MANYIKVTPLDKYAKIRNCEHCVYWLPSDRILDYGYCAKRDCYRPKDLTCDKWQIKATLVKSGGAV